MVPLCYFINIFISNKLHNLKLTYYDVLYPTRPTSVINYLFGCTVTMATAAILDLNFLHCGQDFSKTIYPREFAWLTYLPHFCDCTLLQFAWLTYLPQFLRLHSTTICLVNLSSSFLRLHATTICLVNLSSSISAITRYYNLLR